MSNKYTVHAGHGPHGKLGAGAVGYCSESLVDRQIKDSVIKWLRAAGKEVVDCTYNSPGTQSGIISAIKKMINNTSNVQANISIHLNACKKSSKDGKIKGCECWIYPGTEPDRTIANRINSCLSNLGFTNRGVKTSTSLGVLKGIKNGGCNILVECFFCDDEDDFNKFTSLGADAIGKAIAEGIVAHKIGKVTDKWSYYDKDYGEVDLSPVFNPDYYRTSCAPQERAVFYPATDKQLFEHFCTYGMKEGRQASAGFNVKVYKERYSDLLDAFGDNLLRYYLHYCKLGITEGRKGI